MSRVLARNLFKKKAPKRSAKGVGITSMFEDDVPGYAEGGEVETDDRTERERAARMLLEKNKDEMELYQRFSEGERPQMTRLPATVGVVQQPNPQQMQAMQMQRMAQMGMIPRFQRGGLATSGMGVIGDSVPVLVPGQDPFAAPAEMGAPSIPLDIPPPVMDGREPAAEARPYVPKTAAGRGLYSLIAATPSRLAAVDKSQEEMRRQQAIEEARNKNPVPGIFTEASEEERAAAIKRQEDAVREARYLSGANDIPRSEYEREASRAKSLGSLPFSPTEKEKKKIDLPPGEDEKKQGSDKRTDLSDIKAERAAKAEEARRENMWLALMQAGLAIAGGKSSNAITNIGQGGQAGLASFVALEQQRRRDEDAAVRRDLAQREYQLQERRLNMMEPVYQAQAMSPVIRAQIAAARTQADLNKALGNARLQAIRDVRAEVQKNPMNYTGKDGKPDQLKIQTEIAARQREYAQTKGGSMPSASGGTGGLGLDLPDEYDLGD